MQSISSRCRSSAWAVRPREEVCHKHVVRSQVAASMVRRLRVDRTAFRHLPGPGSKGLLQPCKVAQHERCNTPLTLQAAGQVIQRLYDALNKRDLGAVTALLAEDCVYDNLALHDQLHGKIEVASFYADSIMAVPDEARFLVEDISSTDTYKAGVVWRLILKDSNTLMSRGISFYSLNEDGHIEHVVDNPEHAVKLTQAGVALMSPFVRNLSSPVLPKVKELSHAINEQADRFGLTPFLEQLRGMSAPKQRSLGIQSTPRAIPEHAASLTALQRQPALGRPSSGTDRPTSRAATEAATVRQVIGATAAPGSTAVAPAAAGAQTSNTSSNGRGGVSNTPVAAMPQAISVQTEPRTAQHAPAISSSAASAVQQAPAAMQLPSSDQTPAAAAANSAMAPVPEAGPVQPLAPNMTGLWAKDAARTDSVAFERCLDIMRLSGLQRVTARLIEALDIKQTDANFEVNFVTIVPFFRVTERVPMGSSTQLGRRDLRAGKQTAIARVTDKGVQVDMEWSAPHAGTLKEEYTLLEDGALRVLSTTTIGPDSCAVEQVYVRSAVSKEAFLQQSRSRNGSYNDVMKSQEQRYGK